jgi:hypothetical protein
MHWRMTVTGLLRITVLLFACPIAVPAQTGPQNPPPTSNDPMNAAKGNSSSDDGPALGPMEEEMRVKRAIKYAEKEYQENVERAREVAQLGTQLRDDYKGSRSLSRGDAKKLERLEKLTRRIRGQAGGSEEDVTVDNVPNELEPVLSRLAEVTSSFCKIVEKTPRQVVSASVIDQANVILQLVRVTRRLFH